MLPFSFVFLYIYCVCEIYFLIGILKNTFQPHAFIYVLKLFMLIFSFLFSILVAIQC